MLTKYACDNMAPIPIAMALEDNQWTIDIHVRLPGITEYEITTFSENLAFAIANATNALGHQADLLRNARKNAAIYLKPERIVLPLEEWPGYQAHIHRNHSYSGIRDENNINAAIKDRTDSLESQEGEDT
jgi:hypothetical protein